MGVGVLPRLRRGRDVCRDRNRRHVDSQVQEWRVDPAALIVHAAELDPGGVKAAAAVAGDDVEPLALGDGVDDRIIVSGPCSHVDPRAVDSEMGRGRRCDGRCRRSRRCTARHACGCSGRRGCVRVGLGGIRRLEFLYTFCQLGDLRCQGRYLQQECNEHEEDDGNGDEKEKSFHGWSAESSASHKATEGWADLDDGATGGWRFDVGKNGAGVLDAARRSVCKHRAAAPAISFGS